MIDYLKRSWAEIDLDALAHNYSAVRTLLAPRCKLMAVVKADAYGHGATQVARVLVRCGADWLGVSNIEEGVALRHSGLTQPILVFGTTPPELADMLASENITQTVYSLEYAQALQQQAQAQNVTVACHLKLDSGMTRLGFLCADDCFEATLREALQANSFANLAFGGVFTHFASADDFTGDSPDYTRAQFQRFTRMVAALRVHGMALPLCHAANSAATLCYPEMHLDMVRPGIILYGLDPSAECAGKANLKPVMSLRSVIASVKHIAAGTQVSYGRTFTAPHGMEVAVVPIGYADGYSRSLSNRARMLVNGRFAPLTGRVCMDQLMLDVTNIPQVKRGDSVTVFGAQGGEFLSIDELAGLQNTINYEITCQISKRIPRVYYEQSKPTEVVDYIL